MKIRTTYVCLILSFGFFVNSETAPKPTDRNKRSIQLQNALKKLSKLRDRPFWRNVRQAATKRSAFDSFDLDALFNDPIFLDMDNNMPDYNFDDGSFDLNSLPEKAELPSFERLPDISELPVETKEDMDMSNIVPGAKGPFGDFDQHNEIFDLTKPYSHDDFQTRHQHGNLGDSMIAELLELLELKEKGILDSCLADYRNGR